MLLVFLRSSHLLCGPSSFSNSFITVPELCPVIGYGSLHLFQSTAGWSLSEHSSARLMSAKHNRVSLIVSGIGAYPWDVFPVGPVIGWSCPQSQKKSWQCFSLLCLVKTGIAVPLWSNFKFQLGWMTFQFIAIVETNISNHLNLYYLHKSFWCGFVILGFFFPYESVFNRSCFPETTLYILHLWSCTH